MGKRINTLNTASSPANDDYLPIDGATNGTRKISADFVNNLITDVEVDGTSVVTSGVAEIDLSGKQDTLTAGSNIQIAQDGTISATDTTYTAGTNVQIDNGVISASDTTYTAGTNVQINNNVISATDTTYTAGTNVQINNGVISATDTTYSAFGGATAGADGSSGLVPQPLIADKDKFLKGDGTWDTIQPGASALDDLTNVDITSPTNGQVLKYDSINQEWVNANESGGGGSTVTVTQKTSTGTNIADITVDGVTTQLYAPNGGGGSGDTFITYSKSVTTTQYGWWVVEDENGNTLNPNTYVIIDISVNGFYYDVLWFQDSAGDYRATLFDINDGNTIRSSSTQTWTITYAKKDFSGGGGGGSTVIPNPTDPATDALTSIEIDGTVYSVGGGGSGYTEEVIYSATPSTAAPSTLTLTKPYTDFDMLLFNLYRSADGVMNKYDRVVLTSKLSLNDRIQLIMYNEWASYDITTTTSFTLINEDRMYIGSVVGLKFGQGGGSSFHTYSTTEHKVGTWIDGSDVYEKTISISNVSLSSGSYETVDTITGLDTIISCNGYVVEGNLKYTLNDITLRVIQDGTSVKLYSPSGTAWTISSGAIIIRYTKVTAS